MDTGGTLLARKMQEGGVARSPLPDPSYVGQALANLLEEGFRPLIKTIISAMVLECKIVKVPVAMGDVSVPSMLGLIEIEGAKLQGLICMDTDLSYHLVDLMLGGDPSVPAMPITRSFTAIDMSLCKVPMDALVEAFSKALATCFGRPLTREITVAAMRQNITQVRIAPENGDLLVFNIALDIGEAARAGMLQFFLPLATLDAVRAAIEEDRGESDETVDTQDLWRRQMRNAAATAAIQIDAVLSKRKMTIAELEDMRPGDLFEIPSAAPETIKLVMKQPGEKLFVITDGQLGEFEGAKVIKLNDDVDQRVQEQAQYFRK